MSCWILRTAGCVLPDLANVLEGPVKELIRLFVTVFISDLYI